MATPYDPAAIWVWLPADQHLVYQTTIPHEANRSDERTCCSAGVRLNRKVDVELFVTRVEQ